jgi:hypothetical protein
MGIFAAAGSGAAVGGGGVEAPARTVGEVAMMPGESASRWPLRHRQTLANLQDAGLIPRPVHANQSIAKVHIRRPQRKKQPAGAGPTLRSCTARLPQPTISSTCYRIIASTSCDIVSNVVTVLEFASNARCATIRLENSVEMFTFDCSSVLSSTVPRPPAPATPAVA